jgi:hypothetical protein
MASDCFDLPPKPPYIVDRSRLQLTLGLPFAFLLCASLASWPWRSLGLPGSIGTLTPPAIGLLMFVAIGGIYSVRRGLPVGLVTWLPAGQGAIFLLTTGFLRESEGSFTSALLVVAVYLLMFAMAVIVSVMVSGAGLGWGMAFMSFFILTQVTRFPVFGAIEESTLPFPEVLTLLAAGIALIEVGLITWLARRLVEAAESETTGVVYTMVAFTFGHGIFTAWEEPLFRGNLNLATYASLAGVWMAASALQLAVAFVFIRIRKSWFQEPNWGALPPEPDANLSNNNGFEATIIDLPSAPSSRRSRPRRTRRR